MRNLTFLIALFLALPLFGQNPSTAPAGDELTAMIEKKIQDNDKIHVDHLTITDKAKGVILLEGVADLFGSRYLAGEVASKVKGVKKVDNEIAVETKEVDDLDLEGVLIDKITRHIESNPFDLISIRVNHGFVELYGVVRDTSLIDESFEEAIWVPGVRDVKNKIESASISQGDENLRQYVYATLNDEYPQYFSQAHPAIIIIVRGGRVSLVGYVRSDVERIKIASTIRSIHGVLSVENNLKTN